ncbi:restriction endonuclease subunit S [Faecalibacter rhinopitheci]|uniref:Restriction endonuclease subunit S n=1 Tax=Faecalibacter rhinopitheci TaxID=2779678 RepID=A0A8J7FNZ2_9FLAO|nr:restriction endonuclease subunit S [Faecalibacter rhinopitheci]MBF0597997.1 restriction endonuclease subunit S [Faecalibacter rhinopitheci]
MSKLEELLQGVDVEWLPLGACAVYEQPNKYLVKSKDYNNEYNTPVLTAGKTFILGYTNEKEGIYKASLAPVIIFDDFTTANKWVDFDFKAKSSAMKIIKSKDESKTLLRYIYYWINSLPSDLVEGDHKRQWISNFSKKLIPIPSIEIQQEIVRVLDELTSLTNQLTTELQTERQNRKKQFEFFREQLFRFEEGDVEWKKLGEIFNMKAGKHISSNNISKISNSEYRFPCFGGNGIRGYVKSKNESGNYVLIGRQGALCGNVKRYNGDFYATEHAVVVKPIYKINIEFSYYLLLLMNLNQYASKSAQPGLAVGKLESLKVAIPPLEEQERIVKLLDQFDATHTAIEEEITKEIKLRTQQYEYYREKLLSFPIK